MEFTKKVKKNWLKNLKSGKYRQIQEGFKQDGRTAMRGHCCLAVLDEQLNCSVWTVIPNEYINDLVDANDKESENFVPDYSNVIPLIEELETVD